MVAAVRRWPRRSLAPDPSPEGRRRARNRSLWRDGVLLLAVAAVLAVVWVVAEVPNPKRPAAEALSERLDEVYRAVRAGEVELGPEPTEVADGILGARLERGQAGDRWVLVGEARDCYVLWWDDAGLRRVRTLPSQTACEPTAQSTSPRPETFGRTGRAVPEGEPAADWESVLPDPVVHRVWFVPAIIVGAFVGLGALVRMSIALLTDDDPSRVRR